MSAEEESVTVDMKKEGPSFLNLNRYETDKKKELQPYPEERAPAAIAVQKEAERIKERDIAWAAKGQVKVKPVALKIQERVRVGNAAAMNRYTAEYGSPQEKADQYNRAVQLGMSESNKSKMRETQAEVDRREKERKAKIKAKAAEEAAKAEATAEEGKVEVDLETEGKIDVNFTLNNDYITAITLPDTYFGIIS